MVEQSKEGEARRKDFADRQPQSFSPEYLSPNVNENQLGNVAPDPRNPEHVGREEPSAMELANVESKDEPAHDARVAQAGMDTSEKSDKKPESAKKAGEVKRG